MTTIESEEKKKSKWAQVDKPLFVCANSVTSFAEATALYPFELIKTREQFGRQGMRGIIRHTWRQGGWRGFYTGFSWNVLGGLPSEVLFWVSYNVFKERFAERHPHWPEVGVHLAAGAMADILGVSLWVPMDIICQRMQVQSMYVPPSAYRGVKFKRYDKGTDIIRNIAASDGPQGFWRGVGITMVIQVPATAVQMAGYEHMKMRLMQAWKLPDDHPVVHVAAGGMAGTAAAVVTNPLDVLKTRMQVDTEAKRLRQVFHELIRDHGSRGLLRGIVPRVCSFAPRSSVSFIFYELAMKVASRPD